MDQTTLSLRDGLERFIFFVLTLLYLYFFVNFILYWEYMKEVIEELDEKYIENSVAILVVISGLPLVIGHIIKLLDEKGFLKNKKILTYFLQFPICHYIWKWRWLNFFVFVLSTTVFHVTKEEDVISEILEAKLSVNNLTDEQTEMYQSVKVNLTEIEGHFSLFFYLLISTTIISVALMVGRYVYMVKENLYSDIKRKEGEPIKHYYYD
ncbi:hypothetical protein SNEBB_001073 [Seison nebaliae]|nr:hypothetical protein SNEBB_001073 [Seison nebaliae]